jgi:imidazole glycerol-phosphate synthase subunit HisH
MHEVVVIDYGFGNLLSVRRSLEHCGANVTITGDHNTILTAPRVVLPGVGAFAHGMAELRSLGLDTILRKVAAQGSILLGICLGMQMLLDESEEFGKTKGLGIIPGRVVPISPTTGNIFSQKIPHIGWNNLVLPQGSENWEDSLLQEISPGESVYFLHSFMAVPDNPKHRIANCLYGEASVPATIGRDNIYGCQFHPEKSGEIGLKILHRFLLL